MMETVELTTNWLEWDTNEKGQAKEESRHRGRREDKEKKQMETTRRMKKLFKWKLRFPYHPDIFMEILRKTFKCLRVVDFAN
jgi:hypothetical protein